jgi:hypothetical protein
MRSSFPLVMLLRRIGRGSPQTVMANGSGGASDNDNMEDNDDGSRGGDSSLINDKDGRVKGAKGSKTI